MREQLQSIVTQLINQGHIELEKDREHDSSHSGKGQGLITAANIIADAFNLSVEPDRASIAQKTSQEP